MADAMELPEENPSHYTYADYLEWEGPGRYEVMYGDAYMMASPAVEHQAIVGELFTQFNIFLRGKPCRAFISPLDVRPFPEEDNSDDTVVQPDLLVVCDKGKIAKGSINGAPDLVIEVVSPSNSEKELLLKFQMYLESGVREYWLVYPEEKRVLVYLFEAGQCKTFFYKENAVVPAAILPGLEIALESLWAAAGITDAAAV
jgi:Uma2 family endonuclease